jgi:hypothetical protein
VAQSLTHYGGADAAQAAVRGELIDPRIADVEAVARWMDYAFVLPGGFRFGLAGVVGLIPGIGDIIDALISLYIVHRAVQLRIPRIAITRMVVNVGIEGIAGSIPFIGDFFDIAFKANRRNYQILQRHLFSSRRQSRLDLGFLVLTFVIVGIAVALPVILLAWLIAHFR